MGNDVYPFIVGRPVAELNAHEFLWVAQRIEERGTDESAHRACRSAGKSYATPSPPAEPT